MYKLTADYDAPELLEDETNKALETLTDLGFTDIKLLKED